MNNCEKWLVDFLADKKVPERKVYFYGRIAGFSGREVADARTALKVKPVHKVDGITYHTKFWCLQETEK